MFPLANIITTDNRINIDFIYLDKKEHLSLKTQIEKLQRSWKTIEKYQRAKEIVRKIEIEKLIVLYFSSDANSKENS